MTRSELSASLAERFPGLLRADTDMAVAEILGAIARTLSQGGRVEIRNFGSFALSYRPPRIGRNPMTGDKVSVPGKYTPHFRPGRPLRELVDAGGA